MSPWIIRTISDGTASGIDSRSTFDPGRKGLTIGTAPSRPGSIGIFMSMGTILQPPLGSILCMTCCEAKGLTTIVQMRAA